ncbi:HET-domain-containing protein [Karstenula rhodostoma CBS 690.94]|uniref:HET-domain-containing protein n=1 Tax=Karstenula rhodostoma CBS 690.94 TaxID=1392251 RepID=A0A9P4UJ50_9PLEO|nr:HET-domain-containing protein [Karstenula rhodostoma CBS 690.94]
MAHGPGIMELFSPSGFKHSQLDSFASRTECRVCQFLWCEDLLGSINQANRIRRLSDLVKPGTGPAVVKEPNKAYVVLTAVKQDTTADLWRCLEIKVMSDRGRLLWQPLHSLQVAVSDDSPFVDFVYWRPVRWTYGNLDSLPMLRELLDYCGKSHENCPQLSARRLPTRVLRLSGETPNLSLSLHESSSDELGEYTALSYCWGGPQELCLTTQNLESFKETALEITQLPRTLADAALVTNALGLQFLWVDALCIIQDSAADKAVEIERMCAIYENSVVTIAASTSDSVQNGFLNPNVSYNTNSASCTVPIPIQNVRGEEEWTNLTFSSTRTQHTDVFPINKRGWTFQEAFVPHRLLVFGDIEPFMRCRSSDTVVLSLAAVSYYNSRIEPRRVLYNGRAYNSSYTQANDDHHFRRLWLYIVEQYCLRSFGFEEDRPLAIRGVVQSLQSVYEGQCYHGIWSTCAIGCLLWKSYPRDAEPPVRQPQMPTWSWLSLSFSDIDLSLLELQGSDEGEAMVRFTDAPHKILEITCQVLHEDEVMEADDIVAYWNDHGREWDPEWEQLFLLVLTRTVDQKLLTIEAVRDSEDAYRRRGIMEIRGVEKWIARPKQTVRLL